MKEGSLLAARSGHSVKRSSRLIAIIGFRQGPRNLLSIRAASLRSPPSFENLMA
jgi:hypothetical protein